MRCMSIQFRVDSSSSFAFRARTHTQTDKVTDTTDRNYPSPRLPPAWVTSTWWSLRTPTIAVAWVRDALCLLVCLSVWPILTKPQQVYRLQHLSRQVRESITFKMHGKFIAYVSFVSQSLVTWFVVLMSRRLFTVNHQFGMLVYLDVIRVNFGGSEHRSKITPTEAECSKNGLLSSAP